MLALATPAGICPIVPFSGAIGPAQDTPYFLTVRSGAVYQAAKEVPKRGQLQKLFRSEAPVLHFSLQFLSETLEQLPTHVLASENPSGFTAASSSFVACSARPLIQNP
jgi:hypothetical protein